MSIISDVFGYTNFGDLKMNKKTWIILLLILALVIGIGIFFFLKNGTTSDSQPKPNDYETNRTSSTNSSEQNLSISNPQNTTNEIRKGITESENTSKPKTEEQIATFTTKIYSNDPARQNNVSITCNTLNETIVKNGETFSFCQTVGQASTSKGYQKADIFDKDGNKKKGLGGRKLSNQLYSIQCSIKCS